MKAKIIQLAVGRPRTVRAGGKNVTTGIFKSPVTTRLPVSRLNIEGDGQADLTVHGGLDKAIYVYPSCHYPTWADELRRGRLEDAQFGENLTVSGLDETSVVIGDRYRVGSIEVVVAQPRLPCFKLGIRMNDERFPQRFLASGRLGFYLRIEKEGSIGVGDTFERIDRPDHNISVHDLWRIVFGPEHDRDAAQHALEVLPHLDAGWLRRLKARETCL